MVLLVVIDQCHWQLKAQLPLYPGLLVNPSGVRSRIVASRMFGSELNGAPTSSAASKDHLGQVDHGLQ